FFQGHAAGFLPEGRSAGRRTMAEALGRVRQTLLEALEADCAVRPSAFDASFSREQLAAFVLDSLLGQMSRGADNCEGLEKVLRRLLYR
ncbi:TetR/AcrR family transcriptional regulator, partial [Flavonifractor plautii]|nr:TetR/AcrR family transcriptional regulator [Flavonifractor plautii]